MRVKFDVPFASIKSMRAREKECKREEPHNYLVFSPQDFWIIFFLFIYVGDKVLEQMYMCYAAITEDFSSIFPIVLGTIANVSTRVCVVCVLSVHTGNTV